MDPENIDDKEWKKLRKILFPAAPHSNPEAFVTRVMARLESEEPPRRFFPFSWPIRALGLGVVAALGLFMVQPLNPPINTEALLLGEGSKENPVSWVLQNESPEAEDVLAYLLEEK